MKWTSVSGLALSRVSYALGGQLVYMLGQLGILASLSQIRGAEASGVFGLALAYVTPIFVLANMGLRSVHVIDYDHSFKFSEFANFRLVTSLCAFSVCLLLGKIFVHEPEIQLIIALFAVAKIFESVSELSYGAFEREERFDLVFRSLFLRSTVTFILFFAFLWFGLSLWVAFVSQVIVWTGVALTLDLPRARKMGGGGGDSLRLGISPSRFVALLRVALPIGGANFLSAVQIALLRIFVEINLGLTALGVFTNISYFYQAGVMTSNVIRQLLAARLSRLRSHGEGSRTRHLIATSTALLAGISFMGVVLVVLFGRKMLHLGFGLETSDGTILFSLVAVALSLRVLNSVPMSIIYAYGGTYGQFVRESVFVTLVFVLALVLLPRHGLNGAGVILVIVAGLRFAADLIRCLVSQIRERPDRSRR